MYLKTNKQKFKNREKTKTPLSQLLKNCLNEKLPSPLFSVKKPTYFFTVSVQLNKNFFSKNKLKVLPSNFNKTYSNALKIDSLAYQKFNSYSLLRNRQKQQFQFFIQDYYFFDFLTSTSKPHIISLLNNQSLNNSTENQDFPKRQISEKTSIFFKNSKNLEKNELFDIISLNNYWVEKSGIYSFSTNTGNYWLKNHFLLKNKTVFHSILATQTPSLNNKIVSIQFFLKKQLALEALFFLTVKNTPLKKSILHDFEVLLLEFYKNSAKKRNFSSSKLFFNQEKIFYKLETFKFFLLLSIVPKYLSLIFLYKNSLLFKSLNNSKIFVFQVKHFLKSYQFFYLKQTISKNFHSGLFNYNFLKFVNSFYGSFNNQLHASFLKLVKQGLSNQLNMFGLNLDFSILLTHESNQTLKLHFGIINFKENLKTFTNLNAFFFLKLFNLITFKNIFIQKRLPILNKSKITTKLQTQWLNLAFLRKPFGKRQLLIEVEVFFFFLVKKGLFFGVYSKPQTSQVFSILLHPKKPVLLKLCFLLKNKSCLFINQKTLKYLVLENQKKFVFCENLIIKDNDHFIFYIKNFINQKNFKHFLVLLNLWAQKNYFLWNPLIQVKYVSSTTCFTYKKNTAVNFDKLFKTDNKLTSFEKKSIYFNHYWVVFGSPHFYFIMPIESNLFQHVNLMKKLVKVSAGQTQESLIFLLNQKIHAWCYFYRDIPQKYVFYSLNSLILKFLWRWACRRHNNKSKNWIKNKYFSKFKNKNWIFGNSFLNTDKKDITLFIYLPLYLQIYTQLRETSRKIFN